MRNIVLARVDDRLIHGEVVTAWTPSLSANRIVIVDDTVAADKFNKRVLMALAQQGTKVAVLSVEGATKALQKPDPGNERGMPWRYGYPRRPQAVHQQCFCESG